MSLVSSPFTASPACTSLQPQTTSTSMSAISKKLIRQRFDKASQSYQTHNGVQKRIARSLLDMISGQVTTDKVLLDLGCGPGPDWSELRGFCEYYVGVDLSSTMLDAHQSRQSPTHARLLQADMENLPIADACIDLLYSSMAMQWAGCRRRLCGELRRVLRPGASAFISVPLHGSLQPLAHLRESIDAQPQVNPQPALQDWVDAWTQTGCTIVRADQVCFTEYFSDLKGLLHSIKGVGAGASQAAPLTRNTLRQLAASYEHSRTAAGLPLQYQVGLLHVLRT